MADPWSGYSGGEILSSPVPENVGNNWQVSTPTTQQGLNWADILRVLSSSGRGVGAPSLPFNTVGPQLAPQPGALLYYMPQATPVDQDIQKQTSAGDIDQYVKIFASIFG